MYDQSAADMLDFQRAMIQDRRRSECYLQAIMETVRPGDVVVDIGCGAGLLTLFACMAGAAHVYAFEQGPVIELARQICAQNGYVERVTFLNTWSTAGELPRRADVLVTETIGNLGPDEGIVGWISDGRRRFLKENGRLIPRTLGTIAAPVEAEEAYDNVAGWEAAPFTLHLDAARKLAARTVWWTQLQPQMLLAEPQELWALDLRTAEPEKVSGTARFTAARDGLMHGLGVWFAAGLADQVSLSNAPPNAAPSWQQGFLPLKRPRAVRAGDEIAVRVETANNGADWNWKIT